MPKTASKKPINADKFLDLEKESLREAMVSGGKRRAATRQGQRRGRPKKLQTLAEVQADINLKEFQKAQKKLAKVQLENKELKKNAKKFIKPEELTPQRAPVDDDSNKMMDFLTNVL